jgi:hypothetical protein
MKFARSLEYSREVGKKRLRLNNKKKCFSNFGITSMRSLRTLNMALVQSQWIVL